MADDSHPESGLNDTQPEPPTLPDFPPTVHLQPVKDSGIITPAVLLEHLRSFELSDAEFERLPRGREWVAPGFIAASTITSIVAPPGAGKTSVTVHALSRASWKHQVIYLHLDASDGDVEAFHPLNRTNPQFLYAAPGYRHGDPESILKLLVSLWGSYDKARDFRAFEDVVIVLDTLSLIVDVTRKERLKPFLQLLNNLKRSYGLGFVLVCHTNKHKGADDRYIFEGTGELLAYSDNLINLDFDAERCNEQELVIQTRADPIEGGKQRVGPIQREWSINRRTREVADLNALAGEEHEGARHVQELLRESRNGLATRATAVAYLKQHGLGRNRADALIQKGPELGLWHLERGDRNELLLVSWRIHLAETGQL